MQKVIRNFTISGLAIVFVLTTPFGGSVSKAEVKKINIRVTERFESAGNLFDHSEKTGRNNYTGHSGDDITVSPGREIGTTYYEVQTSGSTGSRIFKDENNGIHFCWMNSINNWSGNRWIYYNFLDPDRILGWNGGTPVSTNQGAGHAQIDFYGSNGATIVYHNSSNHSVMMAKDALPGFGLFTLYFVPNVFPGENYFYWPYLTVDRQERIHVVNVENEPSAGTPEAAGYTRSNNGGNNWSNLAIYDTLMNRSGIVVSSNVDDKVAIVYTRPPNFINPNNYNNDVYYIESEDGTNWNWSDRNNITNYQYGDTIRAYQDVDAVYDFDGNLHIIWITPGYWANQGAITVDACFLWHWSEASGINLITNGWHTSYPGPFNRTISKMSIAVNEDNNLFSLWTQYDSIDVSINGYSNGELYFSYSRNGGINWSEPENVTNSPSPGCLIGECDSDVWPSMHEIVDDSLYICYIEDKNAGTDGDPTLNFVRYLGIPVPVITQTSITIGMIPDDQPVVVRAGDAFTYTGLLTNNTGAQITTGVWIKVRMPGGSYFGPVRHWYNLQVDPYTTNEYYSVCQHVPVYAQPGDYYYIAYSGQYPDIEDSTYYQIEIIDAPGSGSNHEWFAYGWGNEQTDQIVSPLDMTLFRNYPNPFNTETRISFSIPFRSRVVLEVYNILGRRAEVLVNDVLEGGKHSVEWDASGYSSGVYFYRLMADDKALTKRMILLK